MIDDDITLGPSARALLRDAAAADGPPPGTKDRVRVALSAAIAAGAVTAATTASATGAGSVASASTASSAASTAAATGATTASVATTASATGATVAGLLGTSLFTKVAAVAITLGAVGTLAVASGSLDPAPPPAPSPAVPVAEPPLVVPPVAAVERAVEAPTAEPVLEAAPAVAPLLDEVVRRPRTEAEPVVVAVPTVAEPSVAAGDATPSSLALERPILAAGLAALRGGDAEAALARAEEHESRFPTGEMAEDRDRLRVRALCALGRVAEGERARDAFLARYPASMSAASVRALCGAP